MRLIEVIEGEETAPETTQAATTFAQQIRKVPIRALECPGFVVNRILLSTASEVWRYQDESGISSSTTSSPSRPRCRWARSAWPTCPASTPS